MASYVTIVGTRNASASLIALAAASRMRLPCSIERTPASMARRTAVSEEAWLRTDLPAACAFSPVARLLAARELRRVQLVARRHGAAGGHDLDLVDVPANVLAGGPTHLVGAVGDEADHPDAAGDPVRPLR